MSSAAPATLSIGVVVYNTDPAVLTETLVSLGAAIREARSRGALGRVRLSVADNGSADPAALDRAVDAAIGSDLDVDLETHRGHGNVGYGRGHNLAITTSAMDYHLVLNPDVALEPSALAEGLAFLAANPEVGLLAPEVRNAAGERQYLCRRYPSLLVLFMRGFAPAFLKRLFARLLHRYELRDRLDQDVVRDVPIASGCFMLARREALQAVGGFSPEYFLYFEDYDLSIRLRRRASIAYFRGVRITHLGGDAVGKGRAHIRFFLISAWRFFSTHGWKLV